MNIVIIEDERLAANHLEKMIHKYDRSIRVMAKLESVQSAIEWFLKNPEPDLLFLDIHLEDGLSFAIFEKVKIRAPIIFTTAYDEYAIKAFKMKSIDYLLKPVIQDELNQGIEKYKEWNSIGKAAIDINALYEIISKKDPVYKERFSVAIGARIKTFNIDEIAYFYSEESMSFMVLRDKGEYPLDESLDKLGGMVNPKDFFRINRQYLIGLKAIKNVHVFPKSRLKIELYPPSKTEVFVSLDKVTKFKDWLNG
jgi:DNA-binding LytR/AlgR family response regulator